MPGQVGKHSPGKKDKGKDRTNGEMENEQYSVTFSSFSFFAVSLS
jgi:hypothetical protein